MQQVIEQLTESLHHLENYIEEDACILAKELEEVMKIKNRMQEKEAKVAELKQALAVLTRL